MADVNKQTEEMLSPDDMMLDSKPVTKDQLIEARNILGELAIESIPGVGEEIAAKRVEEARAAGDTTGAAIEMAAMGLGLIPGVGDAAGKLLRASTKSLRKNAKLTIDNPGYNSFYEETYAETKQKLADKAKKRAIDSGEKDTYAVNLGSSEGITGYANNVTFKPEELKDIPGAMGEEKIRSSGEKLKRLKSSIKKEGYKPDTILIHVREDGQPFIVEGNHRLAEALESGRKTIDADIRYLRGAEEKEGLLDPRNIFPEYVDELAPDLMKNKGGLMLQKGGAVPMKDMAKQMEMFEDGGLLQEGGSVDEVSGNEVPPGSLKEEVRDDIPAQLSEGEFVFPADVVRYYGLETLMEMRQRAKAGLARMEAMGQMGNADEATLPDDIPFDINDLDIEEEEDEYNYQIGGYVPGQYSGQGYGTYTLPGTGVMQQQPSYLSTYGQQVSQQQPIDYGIYNVPSQQQFKPSTYTPEPYTGPRFEDVIPTPTGAYDELRRYVNAQGQVRMIPFVDGKPLYPIPEGFYPQEEAVAEVMPSTTVGQTGIVRERGEGSQREFEAGQTDTTSVNASKSNLGITGSRGINLGGILTGIGFITNPMSALTGMAAKGLMNSLNIETPTVELGSFGKTDPTSFDNLTPEQQAARTRVETITGTPVTGYVGTQVGDIDPVTGGIFGNHGVAVDVDTGFAAVGPNGMSSFNSVDAGKTAMSTSIQSGYYGGLPSFDQFTSLSEQGKKNAATHINALANTLNDTSLLDVNTTMGAINALYGPQQEATSDAMQMVAQQTLKENVISELEKTQSFSDTASDVEKSTIADVVSGFKSPEEAMNEGVDVDSFSSSTAAAQAGIGYSSYGEDGEPTGAAPTGSQFSKTGTFSTGDKDTSPSDSGPSAPASPGGGGSGPPASEKGDSGGSQGGSASSASSGNSMGDQGRDQGRPEGPGNDGAGSSSGSSCFAAGTKFIMEDGTTKNIEDIKIGDKLKLGGRVYSTIQGDGLIETWYNYGTTKVTGNHAIFENGEWKRVKDAKSAILALHKEEILYTLINENHRMVAEDGVVYTDYDEVDNTGIEEDLLIQLNGQNAEATAA